MQPRTAEFVARLRETKVETSDTLLWWIAAGYDIVGLVAAAVRDAGETPEQLCSQASRSFLASADAEGQSDVPSRFRALKLQI